MQQAAPLVVAAFSRGWIGIGKVIGVTNRADRINITAHLQGLALGVAKVRSTAAPVLWGGGVVGSELGSAQSASTCSSLTPGCARV